MVDQNIKYLDTTSGIVKTSHHAMFDEAWNLQPMWPPAAQLLYDLGLEAEATQDPLPVEIPPSPPPQRAPAWPPMAPTTTPILK